MIRVLCVRAGGGGEGRRRAQLCTQATWVIEKKSVEVEVEVGFRVEINSSEIEARGRGRWMNE